ncbi:MAG: hypothetical protein AAF253_01785 [Pseudomonadota bacterium]
MANVMIKTGGVAAALAASIFLAPESLAPAAHADSFKVQTRHGPAIPVDLGHGYRVQVDHRYRNRGHDPYYYDHRAQRRALKRACRSAIRSEADYIGFRDVDFDSRGRVHQTGARRFQVYFGEVEFEGRRREFERSVSCEIVRGQVRFVDGVPRPGRRDGARRYGH